MSPAHRQHPGRVPVDHDSARCRSDLTTERGGRAWHTGCAATSAITLTSLSSRTDSPARSEARPRTGYRPRRLIGGDTNPGLEVHWPGTPIPTPAGAFDALLASSFRVILERLRKHQLRPTADVPRGAAAGQYAEPPVVHRDPHRGGAELDPDERIRHRGRRGSSADHLGGPRVHRPRRARGRPVVRPLRQPSCGRRSTAGRGPSGTTVPHRARRTGSGTASGSRLDRTERAPWSDTAMGLGSCLGRRPGAGPANVAAGTPERFTGPTRHIAVFGDHLGPVEPQRP